MATSGEGDTGPAVERVRGRLREHYRGSLERKLPALEGWRSSFVPTDAASLAEIRRAGHQLRGSAASFGFPVLSELGGAVEDAAPADVPAALERLIEEVRRALVELQADGRDG